MKKFVRLTAFMISALSLAFIVSCGDDDGDELPNVVGNYRFTSAIVASDGPILNDAIVTDTEGNPLLPAGANVLEQITAAILSGAVDENGDALCANPADTRITLEADNSLTYTCSGGSESVENGNWDLPSADVLTLNILFTGLPTPIPVTLTSLAVGDTQLTGTVENFPLPGSLVGISDPLVTVALDVTLARD